MNEWYQPHNNPGELGIIKNISTLQMKKLGHREVQSISQHPRFQAPFPHLAPSLPKSSDAQGPYMQRHSTVSLPAGSASADSTNCGSTLKPAATEGRLYYNVPVSQRVSVPLRNLGSHSPRVYI